MSAASVIVSMATSSVLGITVTALVPAAARTVVKAHVERASGRRCPLAEVDDIFSPGRRHQIDHQVAVDTKRVDDWVGEGDPLSLFPDAYRLRGELDPDGGAQARHEALERTEPPPQGQAWPGDSEAQDRPWWPVSRGRRGP